MTAEMLRFSGLDEHGYREARTGDGRVVAILGRQRLGKHPPVGFWGAYAVVWRSPPCPEGLPTAYFWGWEDAKEGVRSAWDSPEERVWETARGRLRVVGTIAAGTIRVVK